MAEIWRYYRRVSSIEIADKLLREIEQTARHLSKNALRWRTREELAPGLRSALVHPYVIFYRIDDEIVQIARVLHGRRNFSAIFVKTEQE